MHRGLATWIATGFFFPASLTSAEILSAQTASVLPNAYDVPSFIDGVREYRRRTNGGRYIHLDVTEQRPGDSWRGFLGSREMKLIQQYAAVSAIPDPFTMLHTMRKIVAPSLCRFSLLRDYFRETGFWPDKGGLNDAFLRMVANIDHADELSPKEERNIKALSERIYDRLRFRPVLLHREVDDFWDLLKRKGIWAWKLQNLSVLLNLHGPKPPVPSDLKLMTLVSPVEQPDECWTHLDLLLQAVIHQL